MPNSSVVTYTIEVGATSKTALGFVVMIVQKAPLVRVFNGGNSRRFLQADLSSALTMLLILRACHLLVVHTPSSFIRKSFSIHKNSTKSLDSSIIAILRPHRFCEVGKAICRDVLFAHPYV